jgi:hypothetical protein
MEVGQIAIIDGLPRIMGPVGNLYTHYGSATSHFLSKLSEQK